MSDDLEIPKKF